MIKNLWRNIINIVHNLQRHCANIGRTRTIVPICIMRIIDCQLYLWQNLIPYVQGYQKMTCWIGVWKELHKTRTRQQMGTGVKIPQNKVLWSQNRSHSNMRNNLCFQHWYCNQSSGLGSLWCHSWCTDNESPRKQDDVRIKNAAKKVSEKYRKKRLTRNLTNLGGLFQVPSLLRILNPRREREHQIRKKNNEKIQIKSVLICWVLRLKPEYFFWDTRYRKMKMQRASLRKIHRPFPWPLSVGRYIDSISRIYIVPDYQVLFTGNGGIVEAVVSLTFACYTTFSW